MRVYNSGFRKGFTKEIMAEMRHKKTELLTHKGRERQGGKRTFQSHAHIKKNSCTPERLVHWE